MHTPLVHPHSGWQQEEVQMLFEAVQEASQSGRALRDVFAQVADALQRKPNSIRNFYYSRVRELPDVQQRKAPFRTFTQEELHDLLRNVLIARGNGESVRACVTRLAEGDRAKMLRYQNKYRSILKNRPELLESIAGELRAEGKPCPAYISHLRRYAEGGDEVDTLFEEASRLSQEMGEDLLPLLLERVLGLLRRLREAEQRESLLAEDHKPNESHLQATPDLAITLTDLRGPELDVDDALAVEEEEAMAVGPSRWLEARKEADRLKVQVDLLKMRLEDTETRYQGQWQSLTSLLHDYLSLPKEQRVEATEPFVYQVGEALRCLDSELEG